MLALITLSVFTVAIVEITEQKALEEQVKDPLLLEMLRGAFQRMADHMRNTGLQARPEDPT